MSRTDIKLFKSAMSLVRKEALLETFEKVGLISGGGSGHEYVSQRFKAPFSYSSNPLERITDAFDPPDPLTEDILAKEAFPQLFVGRFTLHRLVTPSTRL